MLPKSQRELLEEWVGLMRQFQTTLKCGREKTVVAKKWEEIKQYFYGQILPLGDNSRCLAWVRETHRLLRILDTQLLFWYSARGQDSQQRHLEPLLQTVQRIVTLTLPL